MSVDVLKSFEKLKLWTSLLQLFIAKTLTFDVYLRLIPQNFFSVEGKRYVNTGYINLLRSENPNHSNHVRRCYVSSVFCCALGQLSLPRLKQKKSTPKFEAKIKTPFPCISIFNNL